MKTYKGSCSAELQSMTVAQKAQNALASAAIPVNIIKMSSSSARRGCSYGIEFACNQQNNVAAVLSASGISVRQWNREE